MISITFGSTSDFVVLPNKNSTKHNMVTTYIPIAINRLEIDETCGKYTVQQVDLCRLIWSACIMRLITVLSPHWAFNCVASVCV